MLVWWRTCKRLVYRTEPQIIQLDGGDVTSDASTRFSFLSKRPGGTSYAALLHRINGIHLRLHDLGSKGADVSADKDRTGLNLHIFWAAVDTESADGRGFLSVARQCGNATSGWPCHRHHWVCWKLGTSCAAMRQVPLLPLHRTEGRRRLVRHCDTLSQQLEAPSAITG